MLYWPERVGAGRGAAAGTAAGAAAGAGAAGAAAGAGAAGPAAGAGAAGAAAGAGAAGPAAGAASGAGAAVGAAASAGAAGAAAGLGNFDLKRRSRWSGLRGRRTIAPYKVCKFCNCCWNSLKGSWSGCTQNKKGGRYASLLIGFTLCCSRQYDARLVVFTAQAKSVARGAGHRFAHVASLFDETCECQR